MIILCKAQSHYFMNKICSKMFAEISSIIFHFGSFKHFIDNVIIVRIEFSPLVEIGVNKGHY